MSQRKSVFGLLFLNLLCCVTAATILVVPSEGQAATVRACEDKQCDGIFYCEAAPGMQCFKGSLMNPQCLTRQCAIE